MSTMLDVRALARTLGLRPARDGYRGSCPGCGYASSFSLSVREGRLLWWCASCTDRAALTQVVRAAAGGTWTAATQQQLSRARSPAEAQQRARDLWDAGSPLFGTLAEKYLRARRVARLVGCLDLRFLLSCPHPSRTRLPSMLAAVRGTDGMFQALHRTFLAPDGSTKARIDPQRASLGRMQGAAVRLADAAPAIVVAEGIETAASASLLLDLPAWAATSAGGLAAMELPDIVRSVTIAADHDLPGWRAADAAARRWRGEGRVVHFAMPDRAGEDFNDVLNRERSRG